MVSLCPEMKMLCCADVGEHDDITQCVCVCVCKILSFVAAFPSLVGKIDKMCI